jgi:hypothetical protein
LKLADLKQLPASPSYRLSVANDGRTRKCGTLNMCDRCIELDKKIEHLQTLAARVQDQMTTDGIAQLVRELRDEKKKLHPDQE